MATALSFNTAKSDVISLLQASQTPYATTVDGSNAQYNSDTEIANAILTADGIIATIICNTLQHPYQTTFIQTSSALNTSVSGVQLPARNGMILKVQGLGAPGETVSFASTEVDTGHDWIEIPNQEFNFTTGLRVQFSTTGALPTGISAATNYYISSESEAPDWRFSASREASYRGAYVEFSAAGSGNSTITVQYEDATLAVSKDQILAALDYPTIYAVQPAHIAAMWFIEGDILYCTSYYSKVVYTDYTLTSSPQCPEPYLQAVVAGAIANLLKDGGDAQMAAYYQTQFENYKGMVAAMATVLPAIGSYVK